jgi:hypothetical protein
VASTEADPRGTKFRDMSYEEQATFLEQAVQEISRHLEEAVAYELDEGIIDLKEDIEAMGTHQESPVQIRESQKIKLHKKGVRCYISKPSC